MIRGVHLRVDFNTHSVGQFLPVLWTITHRFGVPKRFPQSFIPKVRLRVGRQHSQFWPILTHFVDYYSMFWGPGVISMIKEPPGAFTCLSSTLTILSNFDLFRGLLLTGLGVPKRFPWLSNHKARLRVGHQQSQFCPIQARFVEY